MKELKKDVKNGMSKDEALESFISRGGNAKKGSFYLSCIPENSLSAKYSLANNILLFVYGLLAVIGVLAILPQLLSLPAIGFVFVLLLGAVIPAAVVYLIYKKNAMGYLLLAFFCIKAMIDSFKGYQEDPASVWVGVSINAFLLIYVVILKRKIFPYQNFVNIRKGKDGLYLYK